MSPIPLLLAAMLVAQAPKAPAPKTSPAKGPAAKAAAVAATDLPVTVTYKGKGTVDATHKIIVWLFTNPNITADSRPVGTETATKNGDTLMFKGVSGPVYLFAAYDDKGGYDGRSGPPAPGTPTSLYRATPKGAPVAVTAGKAVKFAFDDSQRWK